MLLREFECFHSGINNLTFLLLYEATLLGKWLRTFRQMVRVLFGEGQLSKTILTVEVITAIFLRKLRETIT